MLWSLVMSKKQSNYSEILFAKLIAINFAGNVKEESGTINFYSYGSSVQLKVNEENKSYEYVGHIDSTIADRLDEALS